MVLGLDAIAHEIPEVALRRLSAEFGEWNHPEQIDQAWVSGYTKITQDDNRVHTQDAEVPLVPALMQLAILNALIDGGIQSKFLGVTIIFREVVHFRPRRAVKIGQSIQLRYRVAEVGIDPGGPYVNVEVDLRIAPEHKGVAHGVLSFYLIEDDL